VGLAAWQAARDAVLAAVTNGTLARDTYDVYDVRFAAWLAYLEADDGENPAQVAYDAAVETAGVILVGVAADVWTSLQSLLDDLCSA